MSPYSSSTVIKVSGKLWDLKFNAKIFTVAATLQHCKAQRALHLKWILAYKGCK